MADTLVMFTRENLDLLQFLIQLILNFIMNSFLNNYFNLLENETEHKFYMEII